MRDTATAALVDIAGPAARPAVIAALPAASPEAAARMSGVLLRTVQWTVPRTADPAVRLAFDGYANLSADDRCARVEPLQGAAAIDALLRVLVADPSAAVRWSAANALQLSFEADPALAPRALALLDAKVDYPPVRRNAPLLAAAGWACRATDPARADSLVTKALAIEAEYPSAFRGQADFAYLWAADRASDRGDFATATALARQLAARSPWSAVAVPQGVADLFAGQAEYGPFPGLVDDLRLYRPYLSRPELLYCLGRLARRQGGLLGRGAGIALESAAMAAGGTSAEVHGAACLFLFRHGRVKLADRELRACAWLSGEQAADVYFALAAVANEADDDAAAGQYLDAALRHLPPTGMPRVVRDGQVAQWLEADARAEAEWHFLRAATTAGDRAAALAQARKLLVQDADAGVLAHDPGMAADVVPVLAEAGRTGEADRCFTAAYDLLRQQAAAAPAEAMPKNNLAWLCARSDRHLDEADRLSAAAVALAPADAACLDTRAEVLARTGHASEAVATEERALCVKPRDVYMQRQLARFGAEKPAD